MPAVTITFSLSTNNSGTQVLYSVANSAPLGARAANANAAGDVSIEVTVPDVTAPVVYRFTLPDGQYFHLPVTSTDTTQALGDLAIYPGGVPQGLEDITALISQIIAPAAQPTAFADITGQPTDNTNLAAALDAKAPSAGPQFTGAVDAAAADSFALPPVTTINAESANQLISVGPADSGGTGFRLLRIPNVS
mgnify:CR=1 FL=1